MIILKSILFFLIGLVFGSFGKVIVDRGVKGEKFWVGRSLCDHCHKKLDWWENIPLLSYLFLRGRCRFCGGTISKSYFWTELLFGSVFLLVAWRLGVLSGSLFEVREGGLWLDLVFYLMISFVLLLILLWDWRTMIIPNKLLGIGLIIWLVYQLFRSFLPDVDLVGLGGYLMGGFLLGGFFYLMFIFSNGKIIGGGDVKLGFLLGLLVGWKMVYFVLFGAYVLGAVPAIYLLLTGKATVKTKIPFGPFLVLAGIIVLLFGSEFLGW